MRGPVGRPKPEWIYKGHVEWGDKKKRNQGSCCGLELSSPMWPQS